MTDSIFLSTQLKRKPEFLGFGLELFAKNLNVGQLVMVSKILPGSPAADAGLAIGDNITEVNGINVMGEPVGVTKRRIVETGEILSVRVRRRMQHISSGRLGKSMKPMGEYDLAENVQLCYIRRRKDFKGYGIWTKHDITMFGVRQTFVSHVEHNSPAYNAGIKSGDQILKIDNFSMEHCDEGDVDKIFSKSFDGVTLLIKRRLDKKEFNGIALSRSLTRSMRD